jgi:UDP-N-acetylmuramate dehydrogenase
MNIIENVKISELTTFRTGGNARFFCEVLNEEDIKKAFNFIEEKKLSFFIIGNGSNLLFSDKDFGGLLIKNSMKGIKIDSDNQDSKIISVLAGENFDDLIDFVIKNNLSGIENLWNIPGTVGASVVQNIGAYGVEIKDYIISVEGIDMNNFEKFLFKNEDCNFGYRESIFKKNKNLLITKVYFKLNKKFIPNLKYSGLKEKFLNEKEITLEKVKLAIEEIRKDKLPDWKVLGTAGSFFKNPIVSIDKYEEINKKYPDLPTFPTDNDFVKISLGYVLDKICNIKGFRIGDVGFYEKQALVIVNYKNAKAEEIISLVKLAEEKVFEKIGIKIEREVELIGF